jgi:predicted lipid-binding transport protein (Tim44 family)
MANMIVIAAIAMLAIWLIRRFLARKRRETAPAYAGGAPSLNAGREPSLNAGSEPSLNAGGYGARHEPGNLQGSPGPWGASPAQTFGSPVDTSAQAVPADFDSEAFLRNAKVHFVRLQAAWDAGNMADIREFTTPEMFAEVKIDLDSRGTQPNQTDVVQLNAELLGVEERGMEYLASVRFSGLIREAEGVAAQPFEEIWNLSKSSRSGEGWLLAGIEQTHRAAVGT